ncbi:MAG: helix-hairpin-helix domain-containing protein [Verrucomicrobiales bacterium]
MNTDDSDRAADGPRFSGRAVERRIRTEDSDGSQPETAPAKESPGKKLPLAAAGVALAVAGAITLVKSRRQERSDQKAERRDLPLDPNAASAEELMELPHVGPALAEKIVRARPFSAVEDLLEIPGIGERYLADIAPRLRVDGGEE